MTRTAGGAAKHAPGARRTPFVLLLVGLVVGGLCALLALNTASAANEVERHDLALRDQNIAAQVVQLQNDQQASAAPANLARAAEALGMVPAGNPGFLEVASDGRVRVVGSAAPATAAPLPVPTPTPTSHPGQHQKKKSSKKSTKKSTEKSKSTTSKKPKKAPQGQQKDKQTKTQTKKQTQTHQHTQKTPQNGKHHPQSHHERRAGAPTTTITIPGGPR